MRNSLATKILSIAMMLLTPAAMLMAETGNTTLYASGNVTLNGTEVARSASVAPGDKIETAGATATTINQDGSKVTVNPYSAIRYEAQGVKVVRGTAAVSTTDGMPAQAAQITVAPKDKAATYEIARLNDQVVITSHTGALMITEAGKTTELDAGGSSSRTADPTPAPAPAPQAAPVFPGSELTGRQVFAIAAVVAGAAVATGLWAGMSAAGVPPGGFGNQLSSTSHQGRGLNRVVQVAQHSAVRPVLTSVANGARNSAAQRASQQHRNIRYTGR
ncbi:MAG: hypothetical protein WAN69_10080 [Candidatus Korobacteraceae bacterium]|jgi:hypothetical protein